jgi:hypothetical protein
MHRSESRLLATCAECGAEMAPATDRAFALAGDRFLCFQCAVRRGGSWDEQHDRWSDDPDTADLPRIEE